MRECDWWMVCHPGAWGSTASEELHSVAGQSLSVQCPYKPKRGPYVPKAWCRQTSPNRCTLVVTTSEPRKAVTESQVTIWDDLEAGFFSITMTQLTEKDSAFYWCGTHNASRREVTILRNISLVVSPASPTLPPQMTTWLPTSTATIFVSFLALSTSPEETTGSSINGSEHRNQSSSSPGGISPKLLVPVQYGLLLLKGLMLSVFCMVLCWRRRQGREYVAEAVKMEVSEYAQGPDVSESSGALSHVSGCEKDAYSYSPNPVRGPEPQLLYSTTLLKPADRPKRDNRWASTPNHYC
ncbi:trem-like transcript 4 protein [Acomys russatus]|uniref:trem-like transcript 4 protein n=1 Tax=Acomys russatus TaxID=60746 RepID=UPI0021E27A29|nr:trem-like transcript 4 protein [Acomys russatus]